MRQASRALLGHFQRQRRIGVLAGALLAALTAGCSTAPVPPPQPRIAIPAAWPSDTLSPDASSTPDVPPITVDLAQYWRLLDDPLLTALAAQAIAANRDLAVSAARLDAARGALRGARAGFLPGVSGNSGLSRDVGERARNGLQFSLGTEVSWEADLFGRVSGTARAAEADLAGAGYALADLQRLIVGQVALGAINGRSLSAQLAIARETLRLQDDNLQIARWRNQAGLVSSLDVEQARTQRAQTAATIPQLEAGLAATANALSTLVGEPPGRVLAAFSAPAAIPRPPAIAGFASPAAVLRRRPDVRGAEAALLAASARLGVARAQLLPLVRLSGSLGTGQLTLGNLFDSITGGLFASASQMIFDGGSTRAQIDNAQANASGALAAWEQTILAALEEVESAASERRSAAERITLNEEAVDAATNAALLARSQYQAGLADFQSLLTAESQLLASRNQLVAAQAESAAAFVRLTQALGGGWTDAEYAPPQTSPGPDLADPQSFPEADGTTP